jgi:hypothetical protein
MCTQIGMYWTQSLTNKIIKAAKAVYDFVIYMSGEISKHRYSIYVSWREWVYHRWKYIKGIGKIFMILVFIRVCYNIWMILSDEGLREKYYENEEINRLIN